MIKRKPVFRIQMSATGPCLGEYIKNMAAKVVETGYWSFQWVGKEKGEEERQRTTQSCPRSQIAQKCLRIIRKKERKTHKQIQIEELKAHTQNDRFRESTFPRTEEHGRDALGARQNPTHPFTHKVFIKHMVKQKL